MKWNLRSGNKMKIFFFFKNSKQKIVLFIQEIATK